MKENSCTIYCVIACFTIILALSFCIASIQVLQLSNYLATRWNDNQRENEREKERDLYQGSILIKGNVHKRDVPHEVKNSWQTSKICERLLKC